MVVVCLSVCGALRWRLHTQPPHSTHARTQSPSRKAATCWDALKGDGPSCEATHLWMCNGWRTTAYNGSALRFLRASELCRKMGVWAAGV